MVTSEDDGRTWVREGLAIHDPQPCNATFGGAGYSSVLPARGGPGFRAYGGCTAYESPDAMGAPGSWRRWRDGAFSQPGVNGTSSCLSGVPPNACCPIVHYNAGLQLFVMVYGTWGADSTLFLSTSADGLTWGPSAVLLAVAAPRAIAYGAIVSATSSSTAGLVATLVYAAAPATSGHPRDFIARSITFTP